MTYPNMYLQSLPAVIDLRVGTDPHERALQLSYWQVFAALQAVDAIVDNGWYPEAIVDAGEEANFDTEVGTLLTALTSAITQYNAIWDLA